MFRTRFLNEQVSSVRSFPTRAATSIYDKETFVRRRQRGTRCYDAVVLQVAKAVFAMVHDCPFRSLVSGSASMPVVTHSFH